MELPLKPQDGGGQQHGLVTPKRTEHQGGTVIRSAGHVCDGGGAQPGGDRAEAARIGSALRGGAYQPEFPRHRPNSSGTSLISCECRAGATSEWLVGPATSPRTSWGSILTDAPLRCSASVTHRGRRSARQSYRPSSAWRRFTIGPTERWSSLRHRSRRRRKTWRHDTASSCGTEFTWPGSPGVGDGRPDEGGGPPFSGSSLERAISSGP